MEPDAVVLVGVRDGRIESIEDYVFAAEAPNPARAAEFAALEGRVARGAPGIDRETILALVGAEPVRALGAGVDHRVYAVGDGLVARFGEGAAAEAALLRAIAPHLPLPVPVPTAIDVEAGCLILPRVAGTPLLEAPRPARRAFAAQLLAFTRALHALDPQVEVREDDTSPEAWRDEARATWESVREELPTERRPAVATALAAAAPAPPPEPALIHGDLGAEHVFVDGGRISGVIDWGDAALGDPAVDHGRLLRDFGAPVGERARLYAIYAALEDLAYGLETGDDRYRINALEALDELA